MSLILLTPHNEALSAPDELYTLTINHLWRRHVAAALTEYFERVIGTEVDTPDAQATLNNYYNLLLDLYDTEASMSVPIGTVVMWVKPSAVPAGWLPLSGGIVNKVDYPALWDVWPDDYKTASTLTLANMANWFPRGFNQNANMLDSGGEDTHVLTIDEMPSHAHNRNPSAQQEQYLRPDVTGGTSRYDPGGTRPLGVATLTGSAGGGLAHNNVPGFRYFQFIVRAL